MSSSLIRHKWNTFGRYAFYFNLIYYVLFVGVFTEYMQVGHDLNLILNLGIAFSIAKSPSLQPRTASRPGQESQVSDPRLGLFLSKLPSSITVATWMEGLTLSDKSNTTLDFQDCEFLRQHLHIKKSR